MDMETLTPMSEHMGNRTLSPAPLHLEDWLAPVLSKSCTVAAMDLEADLQPELFAGLRGRSYSLQEPMRSRPCP